jgi:hypothetical protein
MHRSSARPEQAIPPKAAAREASGMARRPVEALRARLGNAGLLRALRSFRGRQAPVVQRDLLAYSREHLEVLPGSGEGGFSGSTYTADATAVSSALAALITAGTVSARTTSEGMVFSAAPASSASVQAALSSFPRAAEMAAAIADPHQMSVYAHERVDKYYGLWPVTVGRGSQVLERQSRRPLTASERSEAQLVFGAGLNYDRIMLEEDPIMGIGGYARTTPTTINFPTGSFGSSGFMGWLIHEMTHSWQYQHGVSLTTTFYHSIFSTYDYGGEAGLQAATTAGRHLRDFNTEQQGDIASDYYSRLKSGANVAAWQPFIAELQTP